MTTIRKNRVYTAEFKQEAISLVKNQGYSVPEAAQSLGINSNRLYEWLKKKEPSALVDRANEDERAELLRLRKEYKRLLMEREILKKAATFFAQENQ